MMIIKYIINNYNNKIHNNNNTFNVTEYTY